MYSILAFNDLVITMQSVFDLLAEVKLRPGLYLGADASKRLVQLQNLELLLFGYALALRRHSIDEPIKDFGREFAEYLHERHQWSTACGPVAAIRDAVKSDDEAWELFWRLVDEFRLASGA